MGLKARLSYPNTTPFSRKTTVVLCCLYLLGFCGLLVFNFLTQAKALQCISYPSGVYDGAPKCAATNCQPASLNFAGTYYTRPATNDAGRGQTGVFPWNPLGFGFAGDKGAIDYSVLSTNWTSQPLSCIMYEQVLTLHLDSGGWTVASCYYCGSTLRNLCTSVDSERTQLAGDPSSTHVDLGSDFVQMRNQIQQVATTSYQNAIILSARMITKRYIPSSIVDSGTLPYNVSSNTVILGTTIGSSVVLANDTDQALANIASSGNALSTLAEQATSEDLQPMDKPRTLQASYSCRQCAKHYKPPLEIFAVVGAAIFAILTPAFAAARILAEAVAPNKPPAGTDPEPALYNVPYKPATSPYSPYPPGFGQSTQGYSYGNQA